MWIAPFVFAIDAEWGAGEDDVYKDLGTGVVATEKFPIVEFSAWENDFAGNALVALTGELTDQLRLA